LIMMDCEENINGKIKTAIRYDVVTDINGDPVDLNNEEGDYWNVLYYTKTTEIGSPLMQNDDEECFAITDYMEGPNKSMPVQTFGYTPAFSLNSGRSEDGVYLHYYTYNSINDIQDEKQEMGKYVETIVMATAKRRVLAQNSILRKSHNYSLIDCNLTPNTDYYTYLGFSTTDDAKKAITDIRVAPSTDAYTFTWGGGNNYIAIYGSDEISNPIKTAGDTMIAEGDPSPFTFQIYVSYSESVGDPILSSSLRIVENINDVPDGYEYTRWFSGAAFDFAMQSDLDDIMNSKRILCYAPEESLRHYNNEPEYLAGFSFFSGFEAWEYKSYSWEGLNLYSRSSYKWYLKDWISELGCKCFASDLTPNAMNDYDDKTYIAYSTTHNPKKAITDIGVFTGEPKSPLLADNITRSGVGFESCTVFYQSDKGYVGKGGKKKVRDIRDSHAYITNLEKEAEMCCNGEWDGYSVKARAMYVAGPTEGVEPILLSEVVYSLTKSDVPTAKGSNRKIYNLSTGKAFSKKAGTGW
nr:hypothetical protein [Clostridia bacterium]